MFSGKQRTICQRDCCKMRKPWLHRRGGPCALQAASSCIHEKNVRRIRTSCEFAELFVCVYCCAAGRGRAAAPTKSDFRAHPYFAADPFLCSSYSSAILFLPGGRLVAAPTFLYCRCIYENDGAKTHILHRFLTSSRRKNDCGEGGAVVYFMCLTGSIKI